MDKWIRHEYLKKETIKEIKASFKAQKPLQSIQLLNFIEARAFKPLQQTVKNAKAKHHIRPDMVSYHTLQSTAPVVKDFLKFFSSQDFKNLVKEYTGITVTEKPGLFGFKHRDYSVLHDERPDEKWLWVGFDALDFDVGYGGYTSFVKEGQELLRIVPQANTLNLVLKPKGIYSFNKYINHYAGKNKRIILGILQKL